MLPHPTSGPVATMLSWLALALAVAAGAPFGCSSSSAKPPPLAACVPGNGALCPSAETSGGSSSPADAGPDDAGSSSSRDASTCGGAETQLASTQACAACVLSGTTSVGGFDCCRADESCSATDCVLLVTCARACAVGDTACLGGCQSLTTQAGLTAYRDFAQCLQTNCPTQCPTLPVP